VVTSKHREVPARIRVAALLDVLHPGAIHAHRDVMLFFARHRAGMTADAAILIDDKSVAHFIPFESENSISNQKNFHLDSREKQEGSNALQHG
jgi:hypothetical protein